ncbi:hypothetical protein CCZ01_08700 [Helicobacter monodelphidis]|uniref:hypothetical protein n=1 Tax=Helicobacter sp. 15-1451 TaxID=2004995 RepID=UPI000DCE2B2D|nr:hypothetical protein [Helicobacter sp. 15-1451]RAX56715.1 hypothetical protein CCZ01_08700 [Helicobacter sp. 15-1451]
MQIQNKLNMAQILTQSIQGQGQKMPIQNLGKIDIPDLENKPLQIPFHLLQMRVEGNVPEDILNTLEFYSNYSNQGSSDLARSRTIETPYGEMRIALKVQGEDYKALSLFKDMGQLLQFDSNNDGIISNEDALGKDLVLTGYDQEGNEIEMNFLEVMGNFDLRELFNEEDKRSFVSTVRPEESHKQMKKDNILDFFKS